MTIEYTQIGKEGGYLPEDIDQESARLEWIEAKGTMTLPFMQGEAIKSIVKGFRIPKVSHIAIHGGITCHKNEENFTAGLYGVRAKYSNGRREVYFADEGGVIVPLGSKLIQEDK